MPEDEIDRIVDRIANRIRNNPSKPLSDHQPAHLLSFNAKHARFFEAKLMQWAAFRLEALHAVLAAERPTTTRRYGPHGSGKSWAARGGRRRPPPVPGLLSGDDRIWRRAGRHRTWRRRLIERVRHDWLRGLLGMLRVRRGGII
jgi:hypothetical protein